ncbi:MAG UNVERIFIED_CONTAM: hypothetical protein LVQ98_01820 [Rickettsiaceae bacterium]|jgi:hypothetical protein
MLKLEIEAAKIGKYRHIVAGFFPKGHIMNELATIVGNSKDSYLILPPSDISIKNKPQEILQETHHYYPISQYLDRVKIYNNQTATAKKTTIEYMVANNFRLESELITNKIACWLDKSKDAKIAVIIRNSELIAICSNILTKRNVPHINLGGYDLSESKIYEFFMLLIEIYNQKGEINIEKLIALLKTKPLLSDKSFKFELNLRKHQNSDHPIIDTIRSTELSLENHIKLAETIYPQIWQSIEGKALGDFLYALLEIEEAKTFEGESYVDFIKSISLDIKYHKNISNKNVFLQA